MDRIRSSEITDRRVYLNRRAFIATALAATGGALVSDAHVRAQEPAAHGRKLITVRSPSSTNEPPNAWEHLTTYNNFYEFGTRKSDPAKNAPRFQAASAVDSRHRRGVCEERRYHARGHLEGADTRGSRVSTSMR